MVNDDYNWYYGDEEPSSSEFDFETVILHEIGHAQQLGHVINTDEVMHFSVGAGQQKRSLSHIDTIGGEFVTKKSTEEAVCGRDLMINSGKCCETMAVAEQPSNQILCPDDEEALFTFNVLFADSWQWQVKDGERYIDLIDNSTYSGTNTSNLTVTRSDNKLQEFQCIATNACAETLTSHTVGLSIRTDGFCVVHASGYLRGGGTN